MRGSPPPLVTSSNNDIDEEDELEEEKFYSHLNITVSLPVNIELTCCVYVSFDNIHCDYLIGYYYNYIIITIR